MPDALDEDAAHLWVQSAAAPPDADEAARCLSLLDDTERARLATLSLPAVRWEYLRTRALVRSALSRYNTVDPRAWRFGVNPWGRPFALGDAGLHFNLSHTRGMLCVVVARHEAVGVDVEWIARPGETVAVAHRYFAPAELAALAALPEALQRDAFFDFWTLKEAYIKARGRGLGIPLRQFAFTRAEPLSVAFDATLGDDPARWDFVRFDPSPGHRIALALGRVGGRPLRWRLRAADDLWGLR
jgi:4'-phosphopantetheinyl transferase